MNKYQKIIDLPHPVPKYHPRMAIENRAVQFAPFTALTGYEEAVKEAGRLTCQKPALSEEEKYRLDLMLQQALSDNNKEAIVTYFVPDQRKSGGSIIRKTDYINRIDEYNRMLILRNGDVIPLNDILSLSFSKKRMIK